MLLAGVAATLCATGCLTRPGYAVKTYRMGDRIELGKLVYNVYETQWHPQFGTGPAGRVPQNRFLLIRVNITNSGQADIIVPNFVVINDNAKEFPELSNGDQVPQWVGLLRSVKPADSLQGNLVFDCTAGHYKLRITDETEQKTALVDLPLTFSSETPEIPSPELPQKQ